MDSGGFGEASSTPIMPQPFSTAQVNPVPPPLRKFYLGEPLALGITQIFIGLSALAFGLVVCMTEIHMIPYFILLLPIWTGILYIISGSLSVAAASNPKMPMVKGMLGMNIVSVVAAVIEIFILSVLSLEYHIPRSFVQYECEQLSSHSAQKCYYTEIVPRNIVFAILVILLLFTILEACISLSAAAFGCKTLCRNTYSETVVVVYQNLTPGNAVPQPAACTHPEIP